MIPSNIREEFERHLCCCVPPNDEFSTEITDTGAWYWSPTRVGNYILLYGRKNSTWPLQCMVGPDWPAAFVVYTLIFVINIVALYYLRVLGPIVLCIGSILAGILLISYTIIAFSQPGIIYTYPSSSTVAPLTSPSIPAVPSSDIECGQCHLKRPVTAHHCGYCGVCVDHLDHHCPWTGKCIGRKNMTAFYVFVISMNVQAYYLIGCAIYYGVVSVNGY